MLDRLRVKRVVVYFDEYLFHLNHRVKFVRVDPKRFDDKILSLEVEYGGGKIRFADALRRYNSLVEELSSAIFSVTKSLLRVFYRIILGIQRAWSLLSLLLTRLSCHI